MVTLIIGKKGSGKTKKLIERVNEAIGNSKGNVVVIEKGLKLTYDISHQARLIDIDAYGIQGLDSFFGFVSGICAGNYDVTDIFVDSTLRIIGPDTEALAILAEKLSSLAALADTKITLSVSADSEELPKSIDAVSIKI